MPPIKVLIADDSSFMRLVLSDMIRSDEDLQIVSTAENGKEAFEKTLELKPDVLLCDLFMPEYDGVYAVKNIMYKCPTPIVILSGSTTSESNKVFEALDAGAYDIIDKPNGTFNSRIRDIRDKVISKIKYAAAVNINNLNKKAIVNNNFLHTFEENRPYDILTIGSSTGGTGAIEEILKKLPANFPIPIVIAQHMPDEFLGSFAKRLNEMLPITVKVVERDEVIRSGVVYLAPGNTNLSLKKDPRTNIVKAKYLEERFPGYNDPSIDCLFLSVAEIYKERAIAIILSGMGKDGTNGMKALFENNAYTIVQDEKSCVVFGMPKSAIEKGVVKKVLPAYEMAGYVVSCL